MARAGRVRKVRSLIIFLLLAIICLGVASCPKGHKNFGGAGLGGSNLPDSPGAYIDIGAGWTTNGVQQVSAPLAMMVSGSIFGPNAKRGLCSVDEFEQKVVSPPSGKLRYCYRTVSGEQVSPMESGVNLYRLTRQGNEMMISEANQDMGALNVSRPSKGNAYLVEINLSGSGDYAFASAQWTVFIRH
ncbi:hypothetical protein A2810_02965 [candidate division Kazan bacterium RIFCSPHIGHO2_01_FULL_49_10]|uniref:Uncharacterized protein n=1 Tax=candidate division Kazan bacterium RIFCSPLOWO2_01_FULL_48_13 TaxID=1798539 RepID=A0A1F4PP39_UNCK3|nr:MAG: hypothetical protein A2810_02965 [candidate division Kazan bacterium RIFCSPHIGHO2_01_FULL_49_10]OGB85356.1 MAG: hypothetical protein A2994_01860 [candidate division Kazan bacterium RIFCSPLOWO2_01_FULL_48_13]